MNFEQMPMGQVEVPGENLIKRLASEIAPRENPEIVGAWYKNSAEAKATVLESSQESTQTDASDAKLANRLKQIYEKEHGEQQ